MVGSFASEQMGLPLSGGAAVPPAAMAAAPAPRRRAASVGEVQMALKVSTAQRVRRHSTGDRHAAGLYAAVLALRAVGQRVYRCGALHQVDGRLLTTRELLKLAGAVGKRT